MDWGDYDSSTDSQKTGHEPCKTTSNQQWFAQVIFTSQVAILSGEKTSDTLETVTKGLFVALTKKL